MTSIPPVPDFRRGSATALVPARGSTHDLDRPPAPGRTTTRIEALDLVRLLAIVGMMSAHLLAPLALDPDVDGIQAPLAQVAHVLTEGTTSTLFAVVAGCSLVLASRRRLDLGDRRGAVASAMVRGACVIGLGLELLPTSVMVVLVPFGLAMMITAPLLLVPSRVLAAIIAVLALVGHPVARVVPGPVEFGTVTLTSLDEPMTVLRGILLTGQYPLITWVPYLLLGVVLMRSFLEAVEEGRSARWSGRALAGGAAVALIGHGLPLLAAACGHTAAGSWYQADPHTGTLGDMLATGGIAVALIGVATWLVPAGRHLSSRPARALRSAGAAPLTVYVGHVLPTAVALIAAMMLSGGELSEMPWYVAGVGVLLGHVLLTVGVGVVLAARESRGPLEGLLSGVDHRLVRV